MVGGSRQHLQEYSITVDIAFLLFTLLSIHPNRFHLHVDSSQVQEGVLKHPHTTRDLCLKLPDLERFAIKHQGISIRAWLHEKRHGHFHPS